MKNFTDFPHNGGATFCAVAYPEKNIIIAEKQYGPGHLDFAKKVIRVEDCSEFTFSLMKTKIKASGGAAGLLRLLETCENYTDFGSAFVSKIYNWIFDNMREASIF